MSQGMPWLRTSYTMTNAFFTGPTKADRLSDRFAVAALHILMQDASENQELNELYEPAISAKEFSTTICKALKVVDLWERSTIKKFGQVAQESQGFASFVAHLMTRGGVRKVLACMDSNTHLHGNSDSNIGIRECHEFYEQFAKCLAGSNPPPAVDPAAAASTPPPPPAPAPVVVDEDFVALAGLVGKEEDKLDENDMKDIEAARVKMNSVEICRTKDQLLQRAAVYESRAATVLIDFPTSSKLSICSAIDIGMEIVDKVKNLDSRVTITMHNRFVIFGEADARLNIIRNHLGPCY